MQTKSSSVADLRGARGTRPPGGPNSFNFMQFLGKFGKIVCWHPPPPLGSWRPLLGEILDPPLFLLVIHSTAVGGANPPGGVNPRFLRKCQKRPVSLVDR